MTGQFVLRTQETALNHVWMSGLLGDGFGATHGMIKNNLIWVVSKMHVQVDQYPIWYWTDRTSKNLLGRASDRVRSIPLQGRGAGHRHVGWLVGEERHAAGLAHP
jgi:hypothetical protein